MAYHLNASSYNVLSGAPVVTDPTEYSIAVWCRPKDTGLSRYITCRTSGGNPLAGWTHQLIMGGVFGHYVYDGTAHTINGSTSYQANKWYHVVITAKNGGEMFLYVNGVSEGGSIALGTMWTGGDGWNFCGPADGSSRTYFWGDLGYLCLWNKQLVQSEITRLYRSNHKLTPLTIQSDSIAFFTPCDNISQGESYGTSYKWRTLGTPSTVINTVNGNTIGTTDFLAIG